MSLYCPHQQVGQESRFLTCCDMFSLQMTHALQEKPLCRSFSALFLLDCEVYVCSGLPSFVLYTQSAKQPSARQLAD
ncbi:hypothetical protein CgunFtcFv8_010993 [Champsocephalus gunnari]|uniref:Uncharacterized protein n=1 Tax=Champsocephalus gunnari TaxID=52237 RepID=A0AAN8DWT4_CHAGU|nr:hypothetical protein CgunFtcFv8_010993 [Champsocephalus gunnari]